MHNVSGCVIMCIYTGAGRQAGRQGGYGIAAMVIRDCGEGNTWYETGCLLLGLDDLGLETLQRKLVSGPG